MAHENDQGKRMLQSLSDCQHGSRTFAAAMIIILLTVLDSYFTLDLVSRGAEELNPIMAYYLERGPLTFFTVKYLLTCAAVIMILSVNEIYIFGRKLRGEVLFAFFILALALV